MEKKRICRYEEAVEYIGQIPRFTSKNAMEDTQKFLQRLGNPDRKMKIIHVAGTNGKGSVCAYLCSVLKSAGYSACLFTSPHLTDIRERFLIKGEPVKEEAFLEAFLTVYESLSWEALKEGEGYHPTFFEYLFFMAMLLFQKSGADFCILETGLGGRLDATNAVQKKELSVITHLALDHTEYLGNTLEKIAGEKAGIMRKGTPVVYWETAEAATKVLAEYAQKLQIPAFSVSKSDYSFLNFHNKSIDFSYRSLYYDSIRLCVNTIARYQLENATLALRALEVLLDRRTITQEAMQRGVRNAFWAGRMEEVLPEVFVDGAHNADGIRAFLETVEQDGCTGERHLLFGVVQEKAYADMIEEILASRLFTGISVVSMQNARALSVEGLEEVFLRRTGKETAFYSSAKEALHALLAARKPDERIYVTGSLYLVGEIKELL